MGPRANEAGEGILHAGEVDLKSGFAGLCAVREDIQNHFLSVDGQNAGQLFPIALLRWRQFVVENNHIDLAFLHKIRNLLGFTGPHQIAGMNLTVVDKLAVDDRDAKRVDKFFEFFQQTGCLGSGRHEYRHRAAGPVRPFWVFL